MSIFKPYFIKHNITLHKGDNLHIILTLLWNLVLRTKLHLYKYIHHINRPIVHYYAVCWNEENILPFVLDYHKRFVNRFIIYDNYSDDHSVEIINKYTNTNIVEFKTDGFNDLVHIDIKNNCWKKSRGKADYVIVCDIDELIHNDDIQTKLNSLKTEGYSIVKSYGYNMYSTDYPQYSSGELITDKVKKGVRHPMMDKCILFDPHSIVEINYKPGAHECFPWGKVKLYRNEDIKLLHYKHIGLQQLIDRNKMYAQRLSKENIENNFGTPCMRDQEIIAAEFRENEQQAIPIIS